MPSGGVRLSVRPSATLVCFLSKRNKHIFDCFHHRHFSFLIPNVMAIFRRGPPNDGVECRFGRQKSRFLTNIWLHRVTSTLRLLSVIHTVALDRGKLVTLIAGKRRPLLFAGDGRRSVYDRKAQRYAKDNGTEFNCTQW